MCLEDDCPSLALSTLTSLASTVLTSVFQAFNQRIQKGRGVCWGTRRLWEPGARKQSTLFRCGSPSVLPSGREAGHPVAPRTVPGTRGRAACQRAQRRQGAEGLGLPCTRQGVAGMAQMLDTAPAPPRPVFSAAAHADGIVSRPFISKERYQSR